MINKKNFYIKNYNDNGFFVIKSLFSNKELKKFDEEILNITTKLKKNFSRPYINLTKDNKLNTAHNLDQIFPNSSLMKIPKKKNLKELIKNIFNENFVIRNLEIFAKPAKTGMKAPFHQDNFYWNIIDKRAVNIWIALDKVTKKNGGLIYLKGSHKGGVLKHETSNVRGTSQEIKKSMIKKLNYQIKTPLLNRGDCLVHHCEVIHGSNPNLSNNNRRAIVLSLKAKTSKIDKKKLNNYLKRLKNKLKN